MQQQLVGQAGIARHGLGVAVIARAGDVAEEIRLALGTRGIEFRGLGPQAPEHFVQRLPQAALGRLQGATAELRAAGHLQVGELLEELLQPEGAFQAGEKLRVTVGCRTAGIERAPEQREARVDARLLAGHSCSRAVVGSGVGDSAANDAGLLVEQHRLGGRGSEIDTDESLHWRVPQATARPAVRRCSIIWK